MRFIVRAFLKWLPLGVAITLVCGLIYVTVQQNYRTSLNDPQIQMAEDAAALIDSGSSVQSVIPSGKVDLERSLSPWIGVYDSNGNVLFQLAPGTYTAKAETSNAVKNLPISIKLLFTLQASFFLLMKTVQLLFYRNRSQKRVHLH